MINRVINLPTVSYGYSELNCRSGARSWASQKSGFVHRNCCPTLSAHRYGSCGMALSWSQLTVLHIRYYLIHPDPCNDLSLRDSVQKCEFIRQWVVIDILFSGVSTSIIWHSITSNLEKLNIWLTTSVKYLAWTVIWSDRRSDRRSDPNGQIDRTRLVKVDRTPMSCSRVCNALD